MELGESGLFIGFLGYLDVKPKKLILDVPCESWDWVLHDDTQPTLRVEVFNHHGGAIGEVGDQFKLSAHAFDIAA
jgi:hypothetical protein